MRFFRRERPKRSPTPAPVDRPTELDRLTGEFQARVERETPHRMAEVEREAARRLAELDAEHPSPPHPPPEPEPSPASARPERGPSWMSGEEWARRLTAYRRQHRSDADIREIAEHLEQRGPLPPPDAPERIERAKSLGMVHRAEYLSPEDEARALEPGPDGLPDARLERVRDRLLVVTPSGWVNPKSRTGASRAGLWSFGVRGTAYHENAARRGDFTPGAVVRLVREPDNEHDPNAIAVYANGARQLSGYVPKGYAKRLAKLLDAGEDMVAVSVRGSSAGGDVVTPHVLVCERALYDHLTRRE